jgi:lysozyme
MNDLILEAESIVIPMCKRFEGFSSKPYLCPAGYWTIGYGTVYKPDGTVVTKDHPNISKALAEEWLVHEIRYKYMPQAITLSPILLTDAKALAAITDFVYNLGAARYKSSTLRRRINAQDREAAKVEIRKWKFGGGRVLPGLVIRREAEAALL